MIADRLYFSRNSFNIFIVSCWFWFSKFFLLFYSHPPMIIQQHFLPLSNVLSDGSNHYVCQHKSLLLRFSDRRNILGFPARLKYWTSSDTYLIRHLSQRAACNGKLRCSQDEPGEKNLGKEVNDFDGYNNSEENKGVGDSRNMKKTVSQEERRPNNKSDKRGFWQVFSGGRSKKRDNMRTKSSTNEYDEVKIKDPSELPQQERAFNQRSKGAESGIQFLDLFYPYGENLLVLLLTGLLVLATGQILVQLLLVSVSILITAVKYSAIAAILLGILVALL